MNAMTFSLPAVRGQRFADAALRFRGRPFVSASDRADCFDCVALLNALTGTHIAASWMRDGGRLPFHAIACETARVGDALIFHDGQSWLAGIMTGGSHVDDRRATVLTVQPSRATAVHWLIALRPQLIGAYRLPVAL